MPRTERIAHRRQASKSQDHNASKKLAAHSGPRYGILGGTFDPPHLGHLVLAQEVQVQLGLERVWFIPTGEPPHKMGRPISSGDDRRAMVELAIDGDARFALSTVELGRPGPSYTADTLQQLREEWGNAAWLSFILGWDMLAYLPEWHDPEGVVAAIDCLVATHRPGFVAQSDEVERLIARLPGLREKLRILPAPQLDLAASSLRERVASGLPIRYLVPDAVCDYIQAHGLYQHAEHKTPRKRSPRKRDAAAVAQERAQGV